MKHWLTLRILNKRLVLRYGWLLPLIALSCHHYKKNESHKDVSDDSISKGEKLAGIYCQSCHMLPAPSLLDSRTWEKGVLPVMGTRLGIFYHNGVSYPSNRYDFSLPKGFYPAKPELSEENWQHIIDYFTSLSPDTLPGQKRSYPIQMGLPLFAPVASPFHYEKSASSYVKIKSDDSAHRVMVSDVVRDQTYFLNSQLRLVDSFHSKGPVVDMELKSSSAIVCNIGVLNPNNGHFGSALRLGFDKQGKVTDTVTIFSDLQRPVQVTSADLNGDGTTDYLICEFGFLTGGLYWMENKGNNQFLRHTLRPLPGAIKAYVQDYNHDGLPDLWVLFAQGDEGIMLYTNKGHGNFSEEKVLRFPPVYGSSYFELDDFNKDGYPDILYTCGDNADYSTVLKPYHGVYIFLNDGANHFKQQYFFPINGCYKAIARDFDGDGDLDLATISFFPDFKRQPEEGFIYLENKGNYNFKPYSLEQAKMGRWLTMDAGDFDGDGRPDLILGNFSIGPSMFKQGNDWKKAPPFLLLKNTGRH